MIVFQFRGRVNLKTKNMYFLLLLKNWLTRNQDNVSEWNDMYIRGVSTIKIQLKRVGRVQSEPHHHIIEKKHVVAMIYMQLKN